MEDKQLDFNQPFLSVRRFSSTAASSEVGDKRKTDKFSNNIPPLPSYKSELKSGPVRNPGTVPFVWEHTPGRPKDESKPKNRALKWPPIAPKLPPGRILNVKQQNLDKVSKDPTITRPQTGNVLSGSQNVSSLVENLTKFESSKEGMEEKGSSAPEDGDEAYVDALDTLSRTESFFLNCSVSGLSGLDGPDVKPSGTFSTDPQTRDFMMGRFLPAAKAMASEAPPYASRKQPVPREQPRQVKEVVSWDKRPRVYHYRPNILPHYAQDNGEEESEDEDDYEEPKNLSAKVCGLLPRFCLKNSLCLLNPVPGLKVGDRVPISPVSRAQAKSSYAGSFSGTDNVPTRDAVYEQRSMGGLQTTVLHEDKSKLRNESNQITYHSDSQKPDTDDLYRRLQGSGISTFRNELPQSLFHEEKGFLGIPEEAKILRVDGFSSHKKGCDNFRELLANQSTERETGSVSPMVEKTLYIDSVHMVESPNSNSSCLDSKRLTDSRRNDFEILLKSRGMEETPSVDSSPQDIKHLNIGDEKAILLPKSFEPVDSNLLSSSKKSNHEVQMDITKGSRQDQDHNQDSLNSANLKVPDDWNFENQQPPKADNQENSHGSNSQFPLPPPLPKSPSESWLWRTLPSMSSRNPSSRSYFGTQSYPREQASKKSSTDPKWETIVKTSNADHGHLRFSEELLTPISET